MNRIQGTSLLALALVTLLGLTATAQLPANTAYVTANYPIPGNGILGYDAAGWVTTFIPLAGGGSTDSIGMAPTNDALLVWDTWGVHRYDLITGATSYTTLYFSPPGSATSWGCIDEHGGMVWNEIRTDGLVRAVDTMGKNATLIWKNPAPGAPNAVCWNGSTGGYVNFQFGSNTANNITFIDRNGVTTLTTTGPNQLFSCDWSPWTGDIIGVGGGAVIRVTQSGTVTTIVSGHPAVAEGNGIEVLDQNGINNEQFLFCDRGLAPTYLALIDGAGAVTLLNSGSYGPNDCEKVGALNLWSVNRWSAGSVGQLNLNMGRAGANDSYQVALALGHLGFNIGTFRLHLSPDWLFRLSALNVLPGVFRNFAGTLDANGLPTVHPSVAIPLGLSGIRVFAGAISYNATGVTNVSNCFGITIQ